MCQGFEPGVAVWKALMLPLSYGGTPTNWYFRYATPATDCWGVGIIAYMLITGGKSPFYGGNRFRTMAKILTCNYELDSLPELRFISAEAKNFIQSLRAIDPRNRLSAAACLEHSWLSAEGGVDTLYTLETRWMKQLLARSDYRL